jgi:hypothetical protein
LSDGVDVFKTSFQQHFSIPLPTELQGCGGKATTVRPYPRWRSFRLKNIFLDKYFPLSYFCIQNSEFKIDLHSREENILENASPDHGIEEPDREETGR